MELILKKDVQNLGFKDDVVTVKNGYGRNFLIPQRIARRATAAAIAEFEARAAPHSSTIDMPPTPGIFRSIKNRFSSVIGLLLSG